MLKQRQRSVAPQASADNRPRIWVVTALWAAVIFVTSCTFIERRVFIDFVKRFIPAGVPRDLWVSFWSYFGIFVVKAYHVTEYTLLCGLLSFTLRSTIIRNPIRAILAGALLSLLYAASDEWHQTFVPGRGGTWVDVVIDGIGICIATVYLLRRDKRNRKSKEPETGLSPG